MIHLLHVLVILAVFLGGCKTIPTEPTPTDEVLTAVIVSNMPGNTEGVPGRVYTFRILSPAVEPHDEIAWDFDTARIVTNNPTIDFTFPHDGWFGVRTKIARKGRLRAIGFLLVNIRSKIPDVALVPIPPGTYLRGSTRGDYIEQPVVQVRISIPLLMSAYEVTQEQWENLMGMSPSYHRGLFLPVESVTWLQAIDFCNRLSIRHSLIPCYQIRGDTILCDWSASGYRLPTEAEWEYAARAGSSTDVYSGHLDQPYGECTTSDVLDSTLDRIAWYCLNSGGMPHPVGQKEPNQWGLYDMIGNVEEMVWDWNDGKQYSTSDTLDPRGPVYGLLRRVRGGSFLGGARQCRAAARMNAIAPQIGRNTVGFRITRRSQ